MTSPIHHVFEPITHSTLQDPARVAVRFENQSWTWQQLSDRVHSNAAAQSALGLAAGGRVAFLDKNHPACLETTLACALVGTVNAVVNFRLAPSELVYVLNDSQAELVFVGAEFVETFELIKPELLHLRKTIVVGGDADEYEGWLQNAPDVAMTHAVSPDDCFLQLYTSGTTGYPKGAMLTHRSGTVTLIEKLSGEACLVQAITGHRWAVHFQAATSVAVTSCQTANRSAISARHSDAESLCRPDRKCGEIPEKADRNRCACPGEVNRFIARSRCRVG